jgi:glycosyltransferase involved in cell wall biosynthesis
MAGEGACAAGAMTSEVPLVSVVIPTYSRPQLVGRAVRSALAQTLEAIEVIAVQDGPNESTVQALAQIDDPRLSVHVLPENLGAAAACNAGVARARAQWVAFLDDDDEFLSSKLELQPGTRVIATPLCCAASLAAPARETGSGRAESRNTASPSVSGCSVGELLSLAKAWCRVI